MGVAVCRSTDADAAGTKYCGSAAVASLEFVPAVSFALCLSKYQLRSFFSFQDPCVLQKAKANTLCLRITVTTPDALGKKSEW